MGKCRSLVWDGEGLVLLDQTKLPREVVYITCRDHGQVATAIKEMKVRGAPAIGAAAAYGLVLGAREVADRPHFWDALMDVAATLRKTRPTAVNLAWALERMLQRAQGARNNPQEALKLLTEEAAAIAAEDVETNRAIGRYGAPLLPQEGGVLTHCNAGALATVDYGTALGVIRAAIEMGKRIRVYACETRPFLQGARLTAYELQADGIPVTLITDNMAGYVMGCGLVQGVVVGADRVAANGDVANKIGTYSLAILAREHGLPFYVAAPCSTIDLATPDGEHIPIEERESTEVSHLVGIPIAPKGVDILNPAFDVTPADYITGIITEKGVVKAPYAEGLAALFRK